MEPDLPIVSLKTPLYYMDLQKSPRHRNNLKLSEQTLLSILHATCSSVLVTKDIFSHIIVGENIHIFKHLYTITFLIIGITGTIKLTELSLQLH